LSTSGVAPAIANAIADACDVELHDLPLTAERVHRTLAAAHGRELGVRTRFTPGSGTGAS